MLDNRCVIDIYGGCLAVGKSWSDLKSEHNIGLDFFISEIPREVFTYSETDPMLFVEPRADIYPYLLVNIGSGVSMVKVSGPKQYERIGGTSLGGGTLWGLLSLLTGARTFDDMLALAEKGDNGAVDMLVGDIYGTDYGKIGLKSTTIASSFGKVFKMKRQAENDAEDGGGLSNGDREQANGIYGSARGFGSEDMSRSLLYAVRSVHPIVAPLVNDSLITDLLLVTISGKLHICSQKSTSLKTFTSAAHSSGATVRL